MANSENQVELKLGLDISGVQSALYDMIGNFTGTGKEFDKVTKKIQDSFKNLEAVIKRYGANSKEAIAANNAYQKSITSLIANGIDPETEAFKKLDRAMIGAGNAASTSGANVKKTNQNWTNLALVVQDLPFGFRGIQNNLPALMSGFAAMTGPLYLAGSAIIALFTAWDNGLFSTKKKTKELKDENDGIIGSVAEEAVKVNSLIAVLKNETETRDRKKRAIKELQNINPDIFKGLKLEGDEVKNLNKFYSSYIENLKNVILLKQYQAELEKIIKEELKSGPLFKPVEPKVLKDAKTLLTANNNIVKTTDNLYGKIDEKTKGVITNIDNQNKKESRKLELLDKISKLTGSIEVKSGGGGGKNSEDEKLKAIEDANKAEIKAFQDTLDERAQKEYQAGLELASNLEKMREAGYTDSTTYYAAYRSKMSEISKYYDEKEFNRQESALKYLADWEMKFYNDSMRAWDEIQKKKSDNQLKYTNLYIESLEAQLKAEMKLHKNNVLLQQEDVQNKINQLKFALFFAAGNVKATEEINQAILKLTGTLIGLGNVSTSINNTLKDTLQAALEGIGQSIGELVATGKFDFNILGNVLADALIQIGKALIMYSSLVKAAKDALEKGKFKAGLIIGIAAVAAGFALKASLNKKKDSGVKEFANGGIVTGPTMGLIGEYPGARSNPEVVAPLDKLKDMIGGGGGSFVLRGQDLVLAMNRSESSLKLRRG